MNVWWKRLNHLMIHGFVYLIYLVFKQIILFACSKQAWRNLSQCSGSAISLSFLQFRLLICKIRLLLTNFRLLFRQVQAKLHQFPLLLSNFRLNFNNYACSFLNFKRFFCNSVWTLLSSQCSFGNIACSFIIFQWMLLRFKRS